MVDVCLEANGNEWILICFLYYKRPMASLNDELVHMKTQEDVDNMMQWVKGSDGLEVQGVEAEGVEVHGGEVQRVEVEGNEVQGVEVEGVEVHGVQV
ncbi:hypothetical protein LIER_04011 [Lithospermum erythrorhizon]|uniref:Uncharacterized protein n=1 Tax=Lithospermum erythrorhizon TaxID=34254 RepID=A0AAV3NV63_LITER